MSSVLHSSTRINYHLPPIFSVVVFCRYFGTKSDLQDRGAGSGGFVDDSSLLDQYLYPEDLVEMAYKKNLHRMTEGASIVVCF